MTSAAHMFDPEAADPAEVGLRAALDLHALAMAGLSAGPQARRIALAMLEWLEGDERDEATGAAINLETALGLNGAGRTHARQRFRQMHRDAALRTLWRTRWPDLSPTAAARVIRQRWRRYDASAWPRDRDARTEPAFDPDATFYRLLERGHKPLARETIRKILGSAIGQFPPVELTSQNVDD